MVIRGTNSSQEDKNLVVKILALDAPADQEPMETLKQLKKLAMKNRRIPIREVVEDVGISIGSRNAIFLDVLSMRSVIA